MKRKKPAPEWACRIVGDAFGHGIAFAEIAERAGYTRSWVTRVLKGEPVGDTAKKRIEEAVEQLKKEAAEREPRERNALHQAERTTV